MNRRILLCGVVSCIAAAQTRPVARTDYIGRSGFPSAVRIQLDRLGDRLVRPGKERVVLNGIFLDAAGTQAPAQLVYQLPNRFRFQSSGPAGRVVIFDGETPRSARPQLDTADEDLLESLLADSADGFFEALRSGAALRLLGRRFHPSSSVAPNYTGPLYDLYELAGAVATRRDRRTRVKRFYFDSATALLLRARYAGIETRVSQWRDFSGAPLPGQIDRWDSGKLVFSFRVSSAEVIPRGDERIFRDPS